MAQASMTTSQPIFSVLRLVRQLDAETFDGLIRSHANMGLQVLKS
jgi:hypothetical protein